MKTIIIIASILVFSSCALVKYADHKYIRPEDMIIEARKPMVIYCKKLIANEPDTVYGHYEYWVSDATSKGFTIISFHSYNVNDTLSFCVKK